MIEDSLAGITAGARDSSLHDKPGRRHNRARLRVVIIVNNRRRGLRVYAEARSKLEIKFCPTGSRPQIEDHAVGKDVVLTYAPIRSLHRGVERRTIDISAR